MIYLICVVNIWLICREPFFLVDLIPTPHTPLVPFHLLDR